MKKRVSGLEKGTVGKKAPIAHTQENFQSSPHSITDTITELSDVQQFFT